MLCAHGKYPYSRTFKEFIMATTSTSSTSPTETADLAQKIHEQLISTVKQGQKLTVDAAQTWAKAVSALPVRDLPKVPGGPALPSVAAATKYTFDVAADLLTAQRDFTVQLAKVFVPEKSA